VGFPVEGFFVAAYVPDPYPPVGISGSEMLTVGAEGHAADYRLAGRDPEDPQQLAAVRVPKVDDPIFAAGSDALATRVEGQAIKPAVIAQRR
jgi:hypothetical protein